MPIWKQLMLAFGIIYVPLLAGLACGFRSAHRRGPSDA